MLVLGTARPCVILPQHPSIRLGAAVGLTRRELCVSCKSVCTLCAPKSCAMPLDAHPHPFDTRAPAACPQPPSKMVDEHQDDVFTPKIFKPYPPLGCSQRSARRFAGLLHSGNLGACGALDVKQFRANTFYILIASPPLKSPTASSFLHTFHLCISPGRD